MFRGGRGSKGLLELRDCSAERGGREAQFYCFESELTERESATVESKVTRAMSKGGQTCANRGLSLTSDNESMSRVKLLISAASCCNECVG
jgi:hypothetical protein